MAIHDALSDKDVEKLVDALIKWSESKDALHLAQFSSKYRKTRTWLYGMADNHPALKEALDLARDNLSSRYVVGTMKSEYSTFAEKYLPIYDKEYKAQVKWKAELSKPTDSEIQATADQVVKAIKDDKLLELLKQD